MFRDRYSDVLEEPRWDSIPSDKSALYPWEEESTYIRLPSFFEGNKSILFISLISILMFLISYTSFKFKKMTNIDKLNLNSP